MNQGMAGCQAETPATEPGTKLALQSAYFYDSVTVKTRRQVWWAMLLALQGALWAPWTAALASVSLPGSNSSLECPTMIHGSSAPCSGCPHTSCTFADCLMACGVVGLPTSIPPILNRWIIETARPSDTPFHVSLTQPPLHPPPIR